MNYLSIGLALSKYLYLASMCEYRKDGDYSGKFFVVGLKANARKVGVVKLYKLKNIKLRYENFLSIK